MRPRRPRVLATLAVALVLACPAVAQAHAVLEATSPPRGAQLERAPARVVFRFGEPVEAAFGSVRVYDGDGDRVDRGSAEHPDGRGNAIAVGLRDGLGHGTYTATYRVVSADSHPVVGGFVFTVGRGGTPAESLDQLIDAGGAGVVTEVGFGVVRALSYLALALAAGAIVFVLAVWRPALAAAGRSGPTSRGRARPSPAGRGSCCWWPPRLARSCPPSGSCSRERSPAARRCGAHSTPEWWRTCSTRASAPSGDSGCWPGSWWALLLALRAPPAPPRCGGRCPGARLLGFFCLTPALAGHAATLDPSWVLVPANFLHVLAMAVWVGGVALLLLALPSATRVLEPEDRTPRCSRRSVESLLDASRCSRWPVLVATGTVQAILDLEAFGDLLHRLRPRDPRQDRAPGRAHRPGGVEPPARPPASRRACRARATPGAAGVELRRALRAELVLMLAVLSVTAALVSYAPPVGATGPVSADATLGPARLELTVDPARVGRNQIHLYLFDRPSGRQWDRAKELTVNARLPDKDIGPLALRAAEGRPRPLRDPARRSGPEGRLAAGREPPACPRSTRTRPGSRCRCDERRGQGVHARGAAAHGGGRARGAGLGAGQRRHGRHGGACVPRAGAAVARAPGARPLSGRARLRAPPRPLARARRAARCSRAPALARGARAAARGGAGGGRAGGSRSPSTSADARANAPATDDPTEV